MLGVAQEKAWAWRGWRDGGHDAHPHFEFARQAVFVNHHYWYILDPEWGPSFVKTNAYAPYPVWVYLNGHEWAKRQATTAGIDFEPLDNGFRACDQAERLAAICDSLSEQDIFRFCDRWMRQLPSPFTAAERGRYGYRYSVRQLELSDTRVFDRPAAGRAWFEQTIGDQLDLGRPDKVQIIFDRKITSRTPGRFQTKVITKGVEPVIQAHYKHSKVKQSSIYSNDPDSVVTTGRGPRKRRFRRIAPRRSPVRVRLAPLFRRRSNPGASTGGPGSSCSGRVQALLAALQEGRGGR